MKIGYSVEGSTDRALLTGLRDRWCPEAELVPGTFRGFTDTSRHREIPRICLELSLKRVDLIIFLTDSNGPNWREVQRGDAEKFPAQYKHLAVFGVCLRNPECWLSTDADHIANQFNRNAAEIRIAEPKSIVESCFCVTRMDKKEGEIAEFVRAAPLRHWLSNPSFQDFFDKLWQKSKELGCQIENLRDPEP